MILGMKDHLPKHSRVAASIRKKIHDGELQISELLPAESTLAEEYGVSLPTVRRALATLRSQGFIETKQGIGTLVIRGVSDPTISSEAQAVSEKERVRTMAKISTALGDEVEVVTARELTISEFSFSQMLNGDPVYGVAGQIMENLRSFVTGSASYLDFWRSHRGLGFIEWGHGPILEDVLAIILPRYGADCMEVDSGVPGLRLRATSDTEAELSWLQDPDVKIILRRTTLGNERPVETPKEKLFDPPICRDVTCT